MGRLGGAGGEQNKAGSPKTPRTERGRKTLRKILDASAIEFGEKGFHEASVSSITQRAGVALGSFYTYFDSKEELFRALVSDLSAQVKQAAGAAVSEKSTPENSSALEMEARALTSFLDFARSHKEVYRIIDESEFVDPKGFRIHYETTANRIHERLKAGIASDELRDDLEEAHAWAIMGMNVFLGLRFAIWDQERPSAQVAKVANDILKTGILKNDEN